jgi:hypothetical protein
MQSMFPKGKPEMRTGVVTPGKEELRSLSG